MSYCNNCGELGCRINKSTCGYNSAYVFYASEENGKLLGVANTTAIKKLLNTNWDDMEEAEQDMLNEKRSIHLKLIHDANMEAKKLTPTKKKKGKKIVQDVEDVVTVTKADATSLNDTLGLLLSKIEALQVDNDEIKLNMEALTTKKKHKKDKKKVKMEVSESESESDVDDETH